MKMSREKLTLEDIKGQVNTRKKNNIVNTDYVLRDKKTSKDKENTRDITGLTTVSIEDKRRGQESVLLDEIQAMAKVVEQLKKDLAEAKKEVKEVTNKQETETDTESEKQVTKPKAK